jgi:UDP-N-acetylmuramate--alanine ligase
MKRVHFIGIGGIGLSALAKFLSSRDYSISGSDIRQSEITDDLALNYGAKITIPHHPDAVEGADMVIYSAVVRANNPEYRRAKELGIELLSRKESLKFILAQSRVYAVGGAHGKSTTSAMLASLLPKSGALIGAISKEFGSNVREGEDASVVFEADESDESFLNSNPYLAVVTNVEPEHMEYYGYDLERFYGAYEKFIALAEISVLNGDDSFLRKLDAKNAIYLYPSKDIKNIEFILRDTEPYTSFELEGYGRFEVFGFGEHIALDAALAVRAAMELGESRESVAKNLSAYRGIKKRFDIVHDEKDFVVIDDYGHHPTEIKATLEAIELFARKRGLKSIRAIWQPHKYSRTMDNLKGFVECFEGVDELVILPIWSAGEIEIPIDLKGAFSRHSPIMADRVSKIDGTVKVFRDTHVVREFSDGLTVAFGAGDISYQIRGEK